MPSDNKAAERFSGTMFNRAFLQNPVLVQALGLCPIVGGAVSLQAGLVLSGAVTAGMILNLLAVHFLLKKFPRWLRMPAYVLITLAAVCPAGYLLETRAETLLSQVGIYLALLAVSSLISVRSEKTFVTCSLKRSFHVAAADCAGYAAVMITVSFVRELAGSGTLWGHPVTSVYFAPGLLLPFGGFLVLGFLAALHRSTVARRFALSGTLKDITFDLSAAAGPLLPPAEPAPAVKEAPAETPAEHAGEPEPVEPLKDETQGGEIHGAETVAVEAPEDAGTQGAAAPPETPESNGTFEHDTNRFVVAPFTQAPPEDGEPELTGEPLEQDEGDTLSEDMPDVSKQSPPGEGGETAAAADEAPDETPDAPGEGGEAP